MTNTILNNKTKFQEGTYMIYKFFIKELQTTPQSKYIKWSLEGVLLVGNQYNESVFYFT